MRSRWNSWVKLISLKMFQCTYKILEKQVFFLHFLFNVGAAMKKAGEFCRQHKDCLTGICNKTSWFCTCDNGYKPIQDLRGMLRVPIYVNLYTALIWLCWEKKTKKFPLVFETCVWSQNILGITSFLGITTIGERPITRPNTKTTTFSHTMEPIS